jgi:predicted O-methyltransferase YrrM
MESVKPKRMIPGQLSSTEMDAIIELAHRVPVNGIIVEVGSLYGLSSWLWAQNAQPSVRVVCLDPWEHRPWMDKVRDKFGAPNLSRDVFLQNVADCPNIEAIQGYSPDCAVDWSTAIDLFFEDADHRNPILHRNISFWSRWVRPGGIAAGHDFSASHPDVVSEVEALAVKWGADVQTRGSVWWVQRPI